MWTHTHTEMINCLQQKLNYLLLKIKTKTKWCWCQRVLTLANFSWRCLTDQSHAEPFCINSGQRLCESKNQANVTSPICRPSPSKINWRTNIWVLFVFPTGRKSLKASTPSATSIKWLTYEPRKSVSCVNKTGFIFFKQTNKKNNSSLTNLKKQLFKTKILNKCIYVALSGYSLKLF